MVFGHYTIIFLIFRMKSSVNISLCFSQIQKEKRINKPIYILISPCAYCDRPKGSKNQIPNFELITLGYGLFRALCAWNTKVGVITTCCIILLVLKHVIKKKPGEIVPPGVRKVIIRIQIPSTIFGTIVQITKRLSGVQSPVSAILHGLRSGKTILS